MLPDLEKEAAEWKNATQAKPGQKVRPQKLTAGVTPGTSPKRGSRKEKIRGKLSPRRGSPSLLYKIFRITYKPNFFLLFGGNQLFQRELAVFRRAVYWVQSTRCRRLEAVALRVVWTGVMAASIFIV